MQEPGQRAVALPLLKAPMAGLIGRIAVGQIVPRSARAQNPKNTVQHGLRIAPRPTSTVGTSFRASSGLSFSHCASVRSMLLIYSCLHNSQARKDLNVFMR